MMTDFTDLEERRAAEHIMHYLAPGWNSYPKTLQAAIDFGKPLIPYLIERLEAADGVVFEGMPPGRENFDELETDDHPYARYQAIRKSGAAWTVLKQFIGDGMLTMTQLKRLDVAIARMQNVPVRRVPRGTPIIRVGC